jgi:hypothetical protein
MQTLSLSSETRVNYNNKCSNCGLVNFTSEAICKRCGNALQSEASQSKTAEQPSFQAAPQSFAGQQKYNEYENANQSAINLRQLLGIAGSIVLFLGVFMPLISMPIVGSLNYFQNGKGDGVIIIVLAGISMFLTLTKRFKGLLVTAFCSFAVMGFTFFRFQYAMNGVREEISKSNNLFKGFGEKMLDTVQLQWGWAVLLVGAGLLIAAAFMKSAPQEDDFDAPARNNTSLYAALAVAGVIITAWICLVIVPQFNAGFNSPIATNSNIAKPNDTKEESAAEAKKREPLLNALSVSISDKSFVAADFYAGRVTDYISFNLLQVNKSAKDIRGFKGIFIIKDIFGDDVTRITFKGDEVLRAGQSKKSKMSVDYNQFLERDKKLGSTEMENLRIEWQPEVVMFIDGTALGLNGEQTYSLENNLPKNADENKTSKSENLAQTKQRLKTETKRMARPQNKEQDSFEDESDDVLSVSKTKIAPASTPIRIPAAMVERLPDGRIRLAVQ